MKALQIPKQKRRVARDFFQAFMKERWSTLRFLTFAENESLLSSVVDKVVCNLF